VLLPFAYFRQAGELIGYVAAFGFSGTGGRPTRRYWTLVVIGYFINWVGGAVGWRWLAGINWGNLGPPHYSIAEEVGLKRFAPPARDVMLFASARRSLGGRGWGFGLTFFTFF